MKNKLVLPGIVFLMVAVALAIVLMPHVSRYLQERREQTARERFVTEYIKTCSEVNPSEKRTAFCQCVANMGVKAMAVSQLENKDYVNQYIQREIAPACGAALVLNRRNRNAET